MGKNPAFQFYPGDWIRDPVSGCSLAAQGLWIRMMIVMHDSERYGYLAINGSAIPPESIARRCGCTLEQYESLLDELERAAVPRRTSDGIIYSKRMVDDEKRRAAERTKKRNQRKNQVVPPVSPECPSPSSSSTSSSPSKKELISSFERFWEVWLKRVNRAEALDVWCRLKPSDELVQKIVENVRTRMASEEWTKEGRQFCPGPAKYLRKRRWEDEVPGEKEASGKIKDGKIVSWDEIQKRKGDV